MKVRVGFTGGVHNRKLMKCLLPQEDVSNERWTPYRRARSHIRAVIYLGLLFIDKGTRRILSRCHAYYLDEDTKTTLRFVMETLECIECKEIRTREFRAAMITSLCRRVLLALLASITFLNKKFSDVQYSQSAREMSESLPHRRRRDRSYVCTRTVL